MAGYGSVIMLPWGGEISLYVFLMVMASLIAAVWTVYRCAANDAGAGRGGLFAVLSGALGLAVGRAVYCGVRYIRLFYDPRGEFIGLSPFLDLSIGGINVIGVILGILLAAGLTSLICRGKGLDLLDGAIVPGLFLFAAERFIEPMNNMGFGDLLTNEAFYRFPFAIENGMGDYSLSVCFIEAVLAALVGLALLIFYHKCNKSGTLAGIGLALLCVTQVMPESLRLDDVLFLFIFARVTQMGYAALLFGTLIAFLIRGKRRGLSGKTIALEILILLLGIGVCVGAEFALDKTNWPNIAIYAVMIAVLLVMGFITVRRGIKEDRANA